MKRLLLPTAVLLAALLVQLASSLAQQTPPKEEEKAGKITISAERETITYGRTTRISGRLKEAKKKRNIPVTLKGKVAPFEKGFELLKTTTTNGRGIYTFKGVRPLLSTRYRADAPLADATSKRLLVQVRIKVTLHLTDRTPKAGELVEFSGTAAPDHDGRPVYIQRRTRTRRWKTVAGTVLLDAGVELSKFSTRIRVRSDGVYRARVIHGRDHAPGSSRPKSLNVLAR